MALDGKSGIRSSGVSPVGSNCPTPEESPSENRNSSFESLDNINPRYGTIIPNRVFVGGIDQKVSERDLWHLFSPYGTLREVNIVQNRSRMTKGFGFVTFENPEDARKLILDAKGIYLRDRRLSIRPAFRQQHNSGKSNGFIFGPEPLPQIPCGAVYHTTSSGFPYTFHNGVAYFHSPRVSPTPHLWTPPHAAPMVPQPCQPVYQQPTYHHYQPRYLPNHFQWNNIEAPVGSGPMTYAQPEYLHHVPDGVPLHQAPLPPLSHMDDPSAEYYDPMMYQSYPMYPPRARYPHFVPPQEYGKNYMHQYFQVPTAPVYIPNKDQPSAPTQPEPESQDPQSAQ